MDARTRYRAERRRERILTKKTRGRVQNSMSSPSGAGSCGDRGRGYNAPTRRTSPLQHDREMVQWWKNDWSAKKIVNIPVEDMLREGWEYSGLTEEQNKLLTTTQDALRVVPVLSQALRLERLLGGSVVFMGIVDGADTPAEPVNHKTLERGALRFLNVIPRNRISKAEFETDPLSANYGRPALYTINGQQVHRSRLLIFDGQPLTANGLGELVPTGTMSRNDGFGESVLEALIADLTNATGTRQGAFNLVNMASVWLMKMDVLSLEETEQGKARLEELESLGQQISQYRAAIMHTDGTDGADLTAVSPSFGSVPELVITFLQVLSAGSDIPATRFIGQAPGGLNATGTSDLENYYNSIESKQAQLLLPQLIKLLTIMGPSVLGESFDLRRIAIEFAPLWNLSEVEESTVRTNDTNNIVALAGAGIISSTEGEVEARERKILISEHIPHDEPIDEPAPNVEDALAQLRGPSDADSLAAVDAELAKLGGGPSALTAPS